MRLIIYPKLSTRSKRAFTRLRTKWNNVYIYQPRIDLIRRLQYELGMPESDIRLRIETERDYCLRRLYGDNYFADYLRGLLRNN